jgi:L-glutamine:2-deoxy-scyllo-inosose/3-amino-2,3-dideoxy-scyllo-inosose aminotransferase
MPNSGETLALLGGKPVCDRRWPSWPRCTQETIAALNRVAASDRWTISGLSTGKTTEEELFAGEFAAYNGSRFCVPVDHGTSALTLALQSCGVGPGDEVLVPGLTWVACATAVLSLGAVPVLVDIDQRSLCMSPELARTAVTGRTRAILIVHLYCSVSDLDQFSSLSKEFGIPMIEDCAQAHGAIWRGRRVGSVGAIGAFSMHQGKPLTCGEGGACVTDDPHLFDLLYRLRTDGRRRISAPVPPGRIELEEVGGLIGRNYCISEFQAAVLRAQLTELDSLNELKSRNAQRLRSKLEEIGRFFFPAPSVGTDRESYYHFVVLVEREQFAGHEVEIIAEALTSELKTWIHPVYDPLYRHRLYQPANSPWVRRDPELARRLGPDRNSFSGCESVRERALALHHSVLLSDEEGLSQIAEAFAKVQRLSSSLHRRAKTI